MHAGCMHPAFYEAKMTHTQQVQVPATWVPPQGPTRGMDGANRVSGPGAQYLSAWDLSKKNSSSGCGEV